MSRKNITKSEAILSRLKSAYNLKRDTELADLLGVKQPTISAWKKRNSIDYDLIFTKCNGLDEHWLLTGERAMLGKKTKKGDNVHVGVYALAGAGGAVDLTEHAPIQHIVIPKDFYSPSIMPIKVRGKSMEPIIMDGAFVGVDKKDKNPVSGEIFAIWIPYEGAVIKRLFFEPDKIIVRSENALFPTFNVKHAEIHNDQFILGRVKWVIQKF